MKKGHGQVANIRTQTSFTIKGALRGLISLNGSLLRTDAMLLSHDYLSYIVDLTQ